MLKNNSVEVNDCTQYTYCKTNSQFRCSFHFLGSYAWNKLTNKEQQIFIYLVTCLRFKKRHKRDKKMICWNNGDIEVSFSKIKQKIPMSSKTMSKAVKSLIGVGLVVLTREGQNKTCHKYKLLFEHIGVPKKHQRWLRYPKQNWFNEVPKHPNNLVGKKSRWKKGVSGNPNFKSHPIKVKGKNDNQTTEVTYNNGNGLQEYID